MRFFLAALVAFVCVSGNAENIFFKDFNSGGLGLNVISGDWRLSGGAVYGSGSVTWPNGQPVYDCGDGESTSITGILCQCVANCDARPVSIQPIAVKGMLLPGDYIIRTSFTVRLPLANGNTRALVGGFSTGVLFDFQNSQNYKGIIYSASVDPADSETYLYCQPFKVSQGQWTYHSNTRCARLNDTNGLVNARIAVLGRDVIFHVNGVRTRTHTYDQMGRGAIGFYPYADYVGFDYLKVDRR